MTKKKIIDKVNAIISAKAGIDASKIKPEDFYDELGADSIQCVEALMEIEKEFAVDIPSDRLMHVSTMQHVYDLVEQVINETMEHINAVVNQSATD